MALDPSLPPPYAPVGRKPFLDWLTMYGGEPGPLIAFSACAYAVLAVAYLWTRFAA